jgi:uncharacterized protein YcfJ
MKNLCTLHSIVALLIMCNFAHAEITLVEDSSSTNKVYMAKVISKKPIIEKVPYMATKNYCEKYYGTVHYSGASVGTPVIATTKGNQTPVCNLVIHEESYNVVKGYQVTYDFKGTLKTAILNNEPSEYVQVYNAP